MSSPLNPKGEILDILAFSITPALKVVCCRYRQIGQPYCCATCDSVGDRASSTRFNHIPSWRGHNCPSIDSGLPFLRDISYGHPMSSLVCRRLALRAIYHTWGFFFLREKKKKSPLKQSIRTTCVQYRYQ